MTLEIAGRLLAATVAIACVLGTLRIAIARIRPDFARGRSRELAVLESAFLPHGASLHVILAGGRRFVVARSASAFAVVCELAVGPLHPVDRDA